VRLIRCGSVSLSRSHSAMRYWSRLSTQCAAISGAACCTVGTAKVGSQIYLSGRESLGFSGATATDIAHLPDCAAFWAAVTSQNPKLGSRLLRPAELPEEIARAKRIVRILRGGGLAPVLRDQTSHGTEYELELMRRRRLASPGHRADKIDFENAA
jgi:hypothetical protein